MTVAENVRGGFANYWRAHQELRPFFANKRSFCSWISQNLFNLSENYSVEDIIKLRKNKRKASKRV